MGNERAQMDLFGLDNSKMSREVLRAAIQADVEEIGFEGEAIEVEVERRLAGVDHTMEIVAALKALPPVACARCGALSPHWLCEACSKAQAGEAPW